MVAAMVASVVVGGAVVAVVLAADATAGVAAMVAIRCFACASDVCLYGFVDECCLVLGSGAVV